MKQTDWDSRKEMEIKKKVTKEIVWEFPDCRGKNCCLMTSLSFTDLTEMLDQKKVDEKTFIVNIDNGSSVKSKDYRELGMKRQPYFEMKWSDGIGDVFGSAKMNVPKHELMFSDIFKTPLYMFGKKFSVVYADTCCMARNPFYNWLSFPTTTESIASDGVLAFTVTLNHNDRNELLDGRIDGTSFKFYGIYDDFSAMMKYGMRMNYIRDRIEKDGIWDVSKMIHYSERNRKSQMVVGICRKSRKTA